MAHFFREEWLRSGKLLSKVLIYESRGAGENRIEKKKKLFQVSISSFAMFFFLSLLHTAAEGNKGKLFIFQLIIFHFI